MSLWAVAEAAAEGERGEARLAVPGARLWSPDSPALYTLVCRACACESEACDELRMANASAAVYDVLQQKFIHRHIQRLGKFIHLTVVSKVNLRAAESTVCG